MIWKKASEEQLKALKIWINKKGGAIVETMESEGKVNSLFPSLGLWRNVVIEDGSAFSSGNIYIGDNVYIGHDTI
ncbi:hypothetical protein PO124_16495 [Bacillus licheniformis]|nr:hypothetical protein [Bacillus licheniformis]